MAQFEFWLSSEDTDRVFAIKRQQGKDEMTGNDFARYLLERELHRLHPRKVEFDENGDDCH